MHDQAVVASLLHAHLRVGVRVQFQVSEGPYAELVVQDRTKPCLEVVTRVEPRSFREYRHVEGDLAGLARQVLEEFVNLSCRHELHEVQSPNPLQQIGHRLVRLRKSGDEARGNRSGARAGHTAEGVAGLIEDEHRADESDALHPSALERQVGPQLLAQTILGIGPAVKNSECFGGVEKLLLVRGVAFVTARSIRE